MPHGTAVLPHPSGKGEERQHIELVPLLHRFVKQGVAQRQDKVHEAGPLIAVLGTTQPVWLLGREHWQGAQRISRPLFSWLRGILAMSHHWKPEQGQQY